MTDSTMGRWQTTDPDDEDAQELGEEELEGEWELDPNDPSHPDFDLSESAGYTYWEPPPKPWFVRRGVILAVTLLVIAGLIIIPLIQLI